LLVHPPVVVDEAHQAGDGAADEQQAEARHLAPCGLLGAFLDRAPRVFHDLDEEEEQDSRG
jgi:hypothetical protein